MMADKASRWTRFAGAVGSPLLIRFVFGLGSTLPPKFRR